MVSSKSTAQTHRPDLERLYQHYLCHKAAPPSPETLLSIGGRDMGLSSYMLKQPPEASTNTRLPNLARRLAQQSHHHGYAYGHCASNQAWILTTPAPKAPSVQKQILRISSHMLQRYCRSVRLDLAPRNSPWPQKLYSGQPWHKGPLLRLQLSHLKDGLLTLSCQPKASHLGPQNWAMIPVGKGPLSAAMILHQSQTPANAHPRQWINQVRKLYELSSLKAGHNALTNRVRPLLDKNATVTHYRDQLKVISHEVAHIHGRFLGENRLRYQSLTDLVWLLWNSPRHRHLLLHPKASHMVFLSKSADQEKVGVMVFAQF